MGLSQKHDLFHERREQVIKKRGREYLRVSDLIGRVRRSHRQKQSGLAEWGVKGKKEGIWR